jgi:protein SCO1/2
VATTPRSSFLPRTPLARAVALLSLAVTLGILGYWIWRDQAQVAGPVPIGGPFTLIDQFGEARTDAEFRGRYMLVFFGFTHCPDVCPVELQTMSDALDLLGAKAGRVVPIFITIDPERDTPEVMRDYAAHFHPRLVALTGSIEAIDAVARAYKVYYAKVTGKDAPADSADYTMDHTAIIYLIGDDGLYYTHFSPGTSAADLAKALADIV